MRNVRRITLLGAALVAAPLLVLTAVSTPAAISATSLGTQPARAGWAIRVIHPQAVLLSAEAPCDGNTEAFVQTPNHGYLYADPNTGIVNGAYSHATTWCVIDSTDNGAINEFREIDTNLCLTQDNGASVADGQVILLVCGSVASTYQTWYFAWDDVCGVAGPDDTSWLTSEYSLDNGLNVLWNPENDTPVWFKQPSCNADDNLWGLGPPASI